MLDKFYNKLFNHIKKDNRNIKSLSDFYLDNVNKKSFGKKFKSYFNNKNCLIRYASVNRADREKFDDLKNQNLIKLSNSLDYQNSFLITFKGILEFEKSQTDLDIIENIIEKIELKFSFESPNKINDYEKIIVYFLLATGASNSNKKFKFPVKQIEDFCYEHLKEISSKLFEIGIIKEDILTTGTAIKAKTARGVFGLIDNLSDTDLYTAGKGNTSSSFYLMIDNDARKELLKKLILNDTTAKQTSEFIINLTQDSLNYFNKYTRFIPELNHAPDLSDLIRIFNN